MAIETDGPLTAEDMIEEAVQRITDADLQQMQIHSSAGGKHAALQGIVEFLRSRSGTAYGNGRDVEARIVRDLANEVEEMRRKASDELQEHIKRAERK